MAVTDKEAETASSSKRKEIIRRLFGKKKEFPVIEIPESPEVPIEIERKAQVVPGAAAQLKKPVIDDQTGQVLVTAPSAQQPKIDLPLTESGIRQGLAYKVVDSIRWLAEWCLRLLKIAGQPFVKKKKQWLMIIANTSFWRN